MNQANGTGFCKVQQRRSSNKRKPLLEGGNSPNSWIILPPRVEESFLEQWRSALSENKSLHEKTCKFDAHWEYEVAVKDLNRNHSRSCEHHEPVHVHPNIFFKLFLWRELRAYGAHLNRVVEINRSLRGCSEIVATAHDDVERSAARARLTPDLSPFLKQLSELQSVAEEFERDYWDKVFCVGSFVNKHVEDWALDNSNFPKMRLISESIWFPLLEQERNLDTTFQIRVGDLLRKYAQNPYGRRLSLLTVSRLVLLVYICAGLALEVDGNLTIWGSDPPRNLTVDRTYETLRDAGLR
jgi:hypothetical protein